MSLEIWARHYGAPLDEREIARHYTLTSDDLEVAVMIAPVLPPA